MKTIIQITKQEAFDAYRKLHNTPKEFSIQLEEVITGNCTISSGALAGDIQFKPVPMPVPMPPYNFL